MSATTGDDYSSLENAPIFHSCKLIMTVTTKTFASSGKEEMWFFPKEQDEESNKPIEELPKWIIAEDDADVLEDKDENEEEAEIDLDIPPERVAVLYNQTKKQTIYLIGTNHYNKQSHRDVRQLIRTVEPAVVMLELCRMRIDCLKMNNSEIQAMDKSVNFFTVLWYYLIKNGPINGFICALVWICSAKKTEDLNVASGGEFRNAFNEALNIPGCSIMLGDRPVDITERRAFRALSTLQKIKFIWKLFFGNEKLIVADIDLSSFKFFEDFPDLVKVLIEERDQYLVHSLISACDSAEEGATIVGVVGLLHLAGIKDHWETPEQIDIAELLKIPQDKPSTAIFVLKYSVYSLIGYGLYRYLVPKIVKNFIADAAGQVVGKVSQLI